MFYARSNTSRSTLLGCLLIFTSITACSPPADWVTGKPSVTIIRMTITGQQRQANCTSPSLLDYLNKSLARPRISPNGGYPYYASVDTSDGSHYKVALNVAENGHLSLRRSEAEDMLYGVDLTAPAPPSYTSLIDFLSEDYKKLKPGTIKTF